MPANAPEISATCHVQMVPIGGVIISNHEPEANQCRIGPCRLILWLDEYVLRVRWYLLRWYTTLTCNLRRCLSRRHWHYPALVGCSAQFILRCDEVWRTDHAPRFRIRFDFAGLAEGIHPDQLQLDDRQIAALRAAQGVTPICKANHQ